MRTAWAHHWRPTFTRPNILALFYCCCCLAVTIAEGGTSSPEAGHGGDNLGVGPVNEATPEGEPEPMDGEILGAIMQSMTEYYKNRFQKWRSQARPHRMAKRDEEVVCYDDLGCFRDEGPFDYLDTLPLPPDRINTRFMLFTAKNPMHPVQMHYANASGLYTPYFNKSNPVKIMIHGFGSSCQKQWAIEMRKALLHVDNVNVICVNWEEGAALPNYVQAAANTRLVGKQVARMIRALNELRGTNNSRFHLIGFSLGAHVAGFAGDEMRNISRITGLDPAAPLFEGYSSKARLDPTDAHFVDVIHSNGDSLLYGGLGAFDPMGHVDYYPNGGKVQAGCSNIFVGAISDLLWYQSRSSDGRSLCNHRRAYKFFTDSVLPSCPFPAFACEDYEKFLRGDCFPCNPSHANCGNMGYFADKSPGRGKLYLLTRNTEPFCANQFKVIIESSPGLAPTYGALEVTLINWNHINETFQVTSEWEQLVPGKPLSRVVVAHPMMNNLISAQIKYTPYKGWITSGSERWAVDRLIVIDSFGRRYSFCHSGLPLAEGKPTTVYLSNEECDKVTAVQPLLRPPLEDGSRPLASNNLLLLELSGSGGGGDGKKQPQQSFSTKNDSTREKDKKEEKDTEQLNAINVGVRMHVLSVSNTGTGGFKNATLTKKIPIVKLHNQALYFPFFPVQAHNTSHLKPIVSTAASKDLIVTREKLLRPHDGGGGGSIVYSMERSSSAVRIPAVIHSSTRMRPNLLPLIASSSRVVRFGHPKSGQSNVATDVSHRLARKLFDDDVIMRPKVVPDISSQIVFVPSNHRPREMYIPLRPPTAAAATRRALNASSRRVFPSHHKFVILTTPVPHQQTQQLQLHQQPILPPSTSHPLGPLLRVALTPSKPPPPLS